MNNQDIVVFTHLDLDGVVSYLVLCWVYGRKLPCVPTTVSRIQTDYEKFVNSKKSYDRLYFLDLDVSKIGELIDDEKTVVLDHHKTNIYSYKKAVTKIYNETSCAKLIYETFLKNHNKEIHQTQKLLIALADDWDSGKRSTPLSEELNIVYHNMNNKFNSFVEDYYDGFKPFDKFKKNTVLLYKKHCEEYLSQLVPFIGDVEFDGQKAKVGAVFCDNYVQECCDYLFAKHNVDISIAVLTSSKRISVRRNSNYDKIDVSKFVQRIASGGGHEAAAGGSLTEEFIEFTKMLKQA